MNSRINLIGVRGLATLVFGVMSLLLAASAIFPRAAQGESKRTEQSNGTSQQLPATPAATPSWAIVSTPSPNDLPVQNVLNDVTCLSANDCWAVGFHAQTVPEMIIEHWNGSSWTITTSPDP